MRPTPNRHESLPSTNADSEIESIKEHPPLTYKDGKYYLPTGEFANPMFDIGPEDYHRELFIEYERTFGRGLAKNITHGGAGYIPGTESETKFFEKFGDDVLTEYQAISGNIRSMLLRGQKDDVEALIVRIREYRRNHQALYEDAIDPNAPKKKFSIAS